MVAVANVVERPGTEKKCANSHDHDDATLIGLVNHRWYPVALLYTVDEGTSLLVVDEKR